MLDIIKRKIIFILIFSLLFENAFVICTNAVVVLWPKTDYYFYDENVKFDDIVPATMSAVDSKKGFLFTGDPREIFELGAGNIAINITLSGAGHTFIQYLDGLKKRGVKITAILCNDYKTPGINTNEAPREYRKPYFYMINFDAPDGNKQYSRFNRVIDDYGKYVDNWVIGNEINSQLYNYYGPSSVEEYTKVYCENFEKMYYKIKSINKEANCFISFDQGFDMPSNNKNSEFYNKEASKFKYNAKEQIELINEYLDKHIDWGISLHPYPAPLEDSKFWDDEYAGYNELSENSKERPYLITLKNFEVALRFLAEERFLNSNDELRKIVISEFALTSHQGEEIQAAGLYFLWEKIKDLKHIIAFHYNAQNDLADGYNFGLTSEKNRRRLIWAVFRDMDDDTKNNWCKDLLDRVLEENQFVDFNQTLFDINIIKENLHMKKEEIITAEEAKTILKEALEDATK